MHVGNKPVMGTLVQDLWHRAWFAPTSFLTCVETSTLTADKR